jgi:hypothetical protein
VSRETVKSIIFFKEDKDAGVESRRSVFRRVQYSRARVQAEATSVNGVNHAFCTDDGIDDCQRRQEANREFKIPLDCKLTRW